MDLRASRQSKAVVLEDSPRSKRNQIVEAAIEVFLTEGYAATSFKKVAEQADVIRATIYSHFKDKEELFRAIIEELAINRFAENFEERMLSVKPEQFVYFMRDFVVQKRNDKQYLRLLRIVIGESERFPELARLYFKTVLSRGISIATKYFELHRELKVKDPRATAAIIGGSLMSQLILQELLYGKEIAPQDLNAIADTLTELMHFGKA